MLTGPLPSSLQNLASILQNAPATLPAALKGDGAQLLTTVRGNNDSQFLQLGNQRVPLQPGSGLQPGDTVRVTLLLRDGASQFQITRDPAGAAAPRAEGALAGLLARLGEIAGRQLPEALVPPGVAAGDAVRQLVQLFQQGNAIGPNLARLAQQLRASLPANHPLLAQLGTLMEQFGAIFTADPAQIAARLKSLSQRRAPEASLLKAGPAALAELANADLASLLAALQENEGLLAALRDNGLLDEFLATANALNDRLDGARAQQLHGQNQGYVFLDLPLPPESGFNHAALHFFHEGKPGPGTHTDLPAVAVLDLDLSGLGPLWISLRAHNATCVCDMLAEKSGVPQILESERASLTAALQESGFQRVEIRAGGWNGDRITQTARMLAGFAPLDLSA